MLERKVEGSGVKAIKARGGKSYKIKDQRGAPDRLMLEPIPEEYRELIAKYVYFVEYKAPGKDAQDHQVREHKRLRKLGYRVDLTDKKERYNHG